MHSNPDLSMRENANRIKNCCHNNRYQPWYLKEIELLVDPEQISHRCHCHLLLIPRNKPIPKFSYPWDKAHRLKKFSYDNYTFSKKTKTFHSQFNFEFSTHLD